MILVTLEEDRPPPPVPLGRRSLPIEEGAPVLVIAYAAQQDAQRLVAVPGVIGAGGTVTAALQGGTSGAPIFDRSGALVGLVGRSDSSRPLVAGIAPTGSYNLIAVADLARTLPWAPAESRPASARERSAADIAAAVQAAVVPITCGP